MERPFCSERDSELNGGGFVLISLLSKKLGVCEIRDQIASKQYTVNNKWVVIWQIQKVRFVENLILSPSIQLLLHLMCYWGQNQSLSHTRLCPAVLPSQRHNGAKIGIRKSKFHQVSCCQSTYSLYFPPTVSKSIKKAPSLVYVSFNPLLIHQYPLNGSKISFKRLSCSH